VRFAPPIPLATIASTKTDVDVKANSRGGVNADVDAKEKIK
jgi:hypothetical protein